MAFPLFTQQMFATLTYHWANTMFGLLALVMSPVPFVRPLFPLARLVHHSHPAPAVQILFWKGPALRARSKFAVSNAETETEKKAES